MKSYIRHIDRKYTKGRLFLVWQGATLKEYQDIIEKNENPIFIGGCGRSGTTLLLSLLSAHPDIYAIPYETKAFTPGAYPTKEFISTGKNFNIDFLYSHLLESNIDIGEVSRWCEKTPMNIHFFSRIVEYFGPRTKFLNIVRDGRDVVTSHHPDDPSSYWIPPARWVRDVQAGRQFEDHEQLFTIKYENLVDDYICCLKRICNFLEEEYCDDFKEYPETSSIKSSSAWFKEADSVQKKSNKRWKKEKHRKVVDELMNMPGAVNNLEYYNYI